LVENDEEASDPKGERSYGLDVVAEKPQVQKADLSYRSSCKILA